jgi:hypothetical protein
MRNLLLLILFAALGIAPAFATIVSPCQSALNAMHAQQEEAWVRQCASAQRRRNAAADAENDCRRWLETCRRAPPARPGFMTF